MERLAQLLSRYALVVVLAALGASALAASVLPLPYDEDVVRFLPADDPEIQRLDAIMERFHGLNVALVGIEADGSLFTPARLRYVRAVTRALREHPEVLHVTSLSEIAVIAGKSGEQRALVPHPIPQEPEATAALGRDVLALDYLVGSVVSQDGHATRIVAQLADELNGQRLSPKTAAEVVRAAVEAVPAPPGTRLHLGGAPFIAEAAANGSQEDLARLGPYVLLVILGLILLSLGSLRAALYTVTSVGLGILWTLGIMGWLGEPLTLVSSSLPVILVALGSAYAVHLLVWYLDHGGDVGDTLAHLGAPVAVTALTTMAGFASFATMDLAPMREFGWQMALGTLVSAGVALVVLPAALTLWPLPPRRQEPGEGRLDRALVRLAERVNAKRWWVLGSTAALGLFFAAQIPSIETKMDTGSFFAEGSAPAEADRFMAERFGGSVFLQILVTGDMHDPAVLHRMAAFEDRLAAQPEVTRVESITRVLAVVHESLKGGRRLGVTAKENAYYGFLARRSDPAVRLLVDKDWESALLQVSLGAFDTAVVREATARIRELARTYLDGEAAAVPRSPALADAVLTDAAERIALLAGLPQAKVPAIARALDPRGLDREAIAKAVRATLDDEILEEEMVELAEGASLASLASAVTDAVLARTLTPARFVALLEPLAATSEREDPAGFARAARYIHTQVEAAVSPLVDGAVAQRVAAVVGLGGAQAGRAGAASGAAPVSKARQLRIAAIVDETLAPTWYVTRPADGTALAGAQGAVGHPVATTVSGYPIIQEAMTRSVQRNQVRSLVTSLPLILLIMVLVFRSPIAGLIGAAPTLVTLAVTYGLMGLLPNRLPLDITSSMLASIALGVGIDYAIHFLWRYRELGLHGAMATTGRSILVNAAEITAGFSVLVGASIVPVSRFGLLTAETLLVAALATLTLLPALLSWWSPRTVEPALAGDTAWEPPSSATPSPPPQVSQRPS